MSLLLVPIEGLSTDAEAALQHEGLPYWIFWLLLCVILLLVAFIFLRNKDLRQKLSLSLYSPRRRFNRLALQARLMRESRKKAGLLQALGRTALKHRTSPKGWPDLLKKLEALETRLEEARGEMRLVSAEMEALHSGAGNGKGQGEGADQDSTETRKKMKRLLAEILSLEKRQDPLLEELGVAVLARRPKDETFLPLYAQIGLVDESITEITTALDSLKRD